MSTKSEVYWRESAELWAAFCQSAASDYRRADWVAFAQERCRFTSRLFSEGNLYSFDVSLSYIDVKINFERSESVVLVGEAFYHLCKREIKKYYTNRKTLFTDGDGSMKPFFEEYRKDPFVKKYSSFVWFPPQVDAANFPPDALNVYAWYRIPFYDFEYRPTVAKPCPIQQWTENIREMMMSTTDEHSFHLWVAKTRQEPSVKNTVLLWRCGHDCHNTRKALGFTTRYVFGTGRMCTKLLRMLALDSIISVELKKRWVVHDLVKDIDKDKIVQRYLKSDARPALPHIIVEATTEQETQIVSALLPDKCTLVRVQDNGAMRDKWRFLEWNETFRAIAYFYDHFDL